NSAAVRTSMRRGRSSLSRSAFNCAASRVRNMGTSGKTGKYSKPTARSWLRCRPVTVPIRARSEAQTRSIPASAANPLEQGAGQSTREQWHGFEAASPANHYRGAHRRSNVVISTLDDDVGMTFQDELKRRCLVEGSDQRHRFERREHRHPVLERVDWTVDSLVQ